jgi:hypothetical protein
LPVRFHDHAGQEQQRYCTPKHRRNWATASASHVAIFPVAEHGVEPEEFEEVVSYPDRRGLSRSSKRPCCWGELPDGRFIICVYEFIDEITILPVTAYEVPMPGAEVEL